MRPVGYRASDQEGVLGEEIELRALLVLNSIFLTQSFLDRVLPGLMEQIYAFPLLTT